jgi:hypothetical protein
VQTKNTLHVLKSPALDALPALKAMALDAIIGNYNKYNTEVSSI